MSEERVAYVTMDHTPSPYVDVRYPDGSLAFRIDLQRRIVEIQRRGQKHYFDLKAINSETIDSAT